MCSSEGISFFLSSIFFLILFENMQSEKGRMHTPLSSRSKILEQGEQAEPLSHSFTGQDSNPEWDHQAPRGRPRAGLGPLPRGRAWRNLSPHGSALSFQGFLGVLDSGQIRHEDHPVCPGAYGQDSYRPTERKFVVQIPGWGWGHG